MASSKAAAAEWERESRNPQWMVSQLSDCGIPRTKAGRRKLRLFACGCCRVAWDLLPNKRLREAIATAERFADGLATKRELGEAHGLANDARGGAYWRASVNVQTAVDMVYEASHVGAYAAAFGITATGFPLAGVLPTEAAETCMCQMVRCVFGNPYRPVAIGRLVRSATVRDLASAIYEERAFDRLPILADALEEAGCDEAAVLAHCRGPGPHVRGCWVVDWALGKT